MEFLVSAFEKLTISNLVKEAFGSEFFEIYSKRQVDYAFRYLNDLKAKSVVLEMEYVDKDYLDDFSQYYVRRFNGRGHKCARLHFFSSVFSHEEINDTLIDSHEERRNNLRKSYLGYMVIKPLPKTFIGRTCLRVYDSLLEEQMMLREYDVSFFGITMSVRSVAFQEQDKVVSACAATATWSGLHAAHWVPLQSIPSCSKITTDAVNFISDSSNSFPSKELSNKQIMRALDVSGQRHYQHPLSDMPQDVALLLIESYVRSRIPLILVGEVYDNNNKEMDFTHRGGHAVSVAGFRLSQGNTDLFVHDDRLGPFVRSRVDAISGYVKKSANEKFSDWVLIIQEKRDNGDWVNAREVIIPKTLIAICPKKVRLPLYLCLNTCKQVIDMYQEAVREEEIVSDRKGDVSPIKKSVVSYEISLVTTPDLKGKIVKSAVCYLSDSEKKILEEEGFPTDPSKQKLDLLTRSMARNQWCAQFSVDSKHAFIVLFDATDIAQGDAVSAIYFQDLKLSAAVILGVKKIADVSKRVLGEPSKESFIDSFLRKITINSKGLADHLDRTYGPPLAPSRLKLHETNDGEIINNLTARAYYEAVDAPLEEVFPDLASGTSSHKIWVIDFEGTLLIGGECENGNEGNELGHPTLTGFRPARISGELRFRNGKWLINARSGRYSKNYAKSADFLKNAVIRFRSIFYLSRDKLESEVTP